jgi:hypothetical protein
VSQTGQAFSTDEYASDLAAPTKPLRELQAAGLPYFYDPVFDGFRKVEQPDVDRMQLQVKALSEYRFALKAAEQALLAKLSEIKGPAK